MITAALLAARAALMAVPGGGFVVAAWQFLMSPVGRVLVVAALAFCGGWHMKAKLDRAATLQAVIAKQRIDLRAAHETADAANAVIEDMSRRDAANQEIIRDLEQKLGQQPGAAACGLDDAAARELRRLR